MRWMRRWTGRAAVRRAGKMGTARGNVEKGPCSLALDWTAARLPRGGIGAGSIGRRDATNFGCAAEPTPRGGLGVRKRPSTALAATPPQFDGPVRCPPVAARQVDRSLVNGGLGPSSPQGTAVDRPQALCASHPRLSPAKSCASPLCPRSRQLPTISLSVVDLQRCCFVSPPPCPLSLSPTLSLANSFSCPLAHSSSPTPRLLAGLSAAFRSPSKPPTPNNKTQSTPPSPLSLSPFRLSALALHRSIHRLGRRSTFNLLSFHVTASWIDHRSPPGLTTSHSCATTSLLSATTAAQSGSGALSLCSSRRSHARLFAAPWDVTGPLAALPQRLPLWDLSRAARHPPHHLTSPFSPPTTSPLNPTTRLTTLRKVPSPRTAGCRPPTTFFFRFDHSLPVPTLLLGPLIRQMPDQSPL